MQDFLLRLILIRGNKLRCKGETRWVEFKNENLPIFCFSCGLVGHGERKCARKKEELNTSESHERKFGDWLRMMNGRGLNKLRNWGRKEGGAKGDWKKIHYGGRGS